MPSRRQQRVRELLIRALGEVIRRELPLEQVGLVSVNDVGLSGDLHSATVFVSILGREEQQKKGLAVLQRERKRLQGLISREVVLKNTPHLAFVLDDSVQRGNRVLQILDELERSSLADESPS